MGATRAVSRPRAEFALHGPDERIEKIEEQRIAALEDLTDLILHQRAEDDWPQTALRACRVDPAQGLFRLVNAGNEWQSRDPDLKALKLCQETVPHSLRRHAGLV